MKTTTMTDVNLAKAFRKIKDELRGRKLLTDVYEPNARRLLNSVDREVLRKMGLPVPTRKRTTVT